MTPAARVQAAIEILDLVIAAARDSGPPADRIVTEWFRTRRFAGSGDRRAVRDLVYRAIRACGEVPAHGREAMLQMVREDASLAALFDGSRHGPAPVGEAELSQGSGDPGVAPRWLERELAASAIAGDELRALLGRAPLDIRVNTLKAARETIELPVPGEATASPNGLRLPHGTPIETWASYADGLIEVQDTGSQLACLAVAAQPGETVVDLCGGAGGKTLALAAAMENRGTLIAADVDRTRLARLGPRAARAGAAIAGTVLLDPGREGEALTELAGRSDAVLIDAPCSGTGTWRRNPEARWRLGEAQLARYVGQQSRLLDVGAELARVGGRMIYVTCSLLDAEGADQIKAFLARNAGWRSEPLSLPAGTPRGGGTRLTPLCDGTDGFFIARLVRLC